MDAVVVVLPLSLAFWARFYLQIVETGTVFNRSWLFRTENFLEREGERVKAKGGERGK